MLKGKEIYCSVNTCHYWKNGNICDANEIMVTSDSMGAQAPDHFDAPDYQSFQQTPVDTCMQTCCKTFAPSGRGAENFDGVRRI